MNIVISGASKGIGKALAMRFAAMNDNIFICSRNQSAIRQAASEIKNSKKGVNVFYQAADLSKKEDALSFADLINHHCENVDVLINNAGTFLPGSVFDEEEGTLESMIENNLYSAYRLTRALLPKMMKPGRGHIFNICSIASLKAYPNGGSYSISKFALAGFSKNLREEMKPYNIKVTSVYPGAVYTDSWKGSGLPEERFMKAEDIAEIIYSASVLSLQACVEDLVIRPQLGDI
ncbi:MAG: SDR family NAD(P)-dependent oxidoreductase [Chitinophagaceae bacterium]|nr:SDR family NAD(P)-dependent oxidoreductase [Chitinophagaceae bacterium]